MKLNEKLIKPIREVNYLRAENAERYRVIMRCFYHEHEKIRYWLYKEDVFQMMKQFSLFQDYTIEQCQSDLQALYEWGNLSAHQDTSKVHTVQEFKNRKYRYQLSEYSVAIERLTIELEQLEIEGASLQPTLLERIRNQILMMKDKKEESEEAVYGWWHGLNDDFIRLNQNYQDYIRTLNSARAEQLMKSKEFLIFKDKLISYLRTFITHLQQHALAIEQYLRTLQKEDLDVIFQKVSAYELTIPRLGKELKKEEVLEQCYGRWRSLYEWFVAEQGENEVDRLYQITNDIIRRITRYALQIGEFHSQGTNRREEYRHIASIFARCKDMREAHELSAMVFGCETLFHLKHLQPRETDSIHSGVYEEKPISLEMEPRTRIARKKTMRKPAEDFTFEKQVQKQELIRQMEEQEQKIKALVKEGKIVCSALPPLDAAIRKTLLSWISRAMASKSRQAKTDQGQSYRVSLEKEGECQVVFEDGSLTMPCFVLTFDEEKTS